MVSKSQPQILLMLLIALIPSQGCTPQRFPATPVLGILPTSTAIPIPLPFFAQEKEPANAYMDASLTGKLVIVDGCVRLQSNNSSHLIIWPSNFSLRADGKIIEILNGHKQIVALLGDNVRIGGGERPTVGGYISQPLPEECKGPYWIASDKITRLE